jgi:uncharacterized protein YPO0396
MTKGSFRNILGMTYEEWLKALDKVMVMKMGLPHDCVEDYLWRDCYDSGSTPERAFEDYIYDIHPEYEDILTYKGETP